VGCIWNFACFDSLEYLFMLLVIFCICDVCENASKKYSTKCEKYIYVKPFLDKVNLFSFNYKLFWRTQGLYGKIHICAYSLSTKS